VNKMKGLTIAKGVAYNVLKENEEKYKRWLRLQKIKLLRLE
jgi:hypothetical protein